MSIKIQEILAQVKELISQRSETPSLDAQVLISHFLEVPRSWVLAHPEAQLDKFHHQLITQAMERLVLGDPLPYIIGHWEFFGLDFTLTPDVLIPRPETELLVEHGISWLLDHPDQRNAIDIGTGSGCIGIALAKNIPDLKVLMVDISSDALAVSRVNAEKHGLLNRLEFRQADLLIGIEGYFDLICANLPYIPTLLLNSLAVVKKEPRLALDGGKTGLDLITRLLDQCRSHLSTGGTILIELESSLGAEVSSLASNYFPASQLELYKDFSGFDRCLQITPANYIIHLCQEIEWQAAQQLGIFKNKSLDQEGFIHCSQPHQILQVANRFYQGIPGLILCWIDPMKITSVIRWEESDGAIFPHIYGSINLDAVVSVNPIKPDTDGLYRKIQLP